MQRNHMSIDASVSKSQMDKSPQNNSQQDLNRSGISEGKS